MKKIFKAFLPYRDLIFSLVMFVVCGLALTLGLIPIGKTALNRLYNLQSLTSEVKALQKKNAFLQSLDEDSLIKQNALLLSSVPSGKSPPSLLSTIEGVSAQSGTAIVEIMIMSPGAMASGSSALKTNEERKYGYSLLPLSVSLEGSYEQIKMFMTNLSRTRRTMRIKNFALNMKSSEMYALRADLEGFYASQPSNLGKTSSQLEPLTVSEETMLTRLDAQQSYSEIDEQASLPLGEFKANPFIR